MSFKKAYFKLLRVWFKAVFLLIFFISTLIICVSVFQLIKEGHTEYPWFALLFLVLTSCLSFLGFKYVKL